MAKWTLLYNETVIDSNDTGQFSIPSTYDVGAEFYIVYHYKESDEQKIKYTRTKTCCSCDDVTFTYADNRYFNVSAQDAILGTISYGQRCDRSNIQVYGDESFESIEITSNNTVKARLKQYSQTFDETGRRLQFWFKVNGNSCGDIYEVYQQAWKGTDNGMDFFANGFLLDYPILLCACGDSSDGDSIVAENGAWLYVPENQQFVELDAPEFNRVYPNGYVVDDWCKFTCADKHDPNPDARGKCGVGMVHIQALSDNPSPTEIRKAQIILSSVNNKNAQPVNVHPEAPIDWHPGEQCALKWSYDVWQLPRNYSMLYQDDGLNFLLKTNAEMQAEMQRNPTCARKGLTCFGWNKAWICTNYSCN